MHGNELIAKIKMRKKYVGVMCKWK